VILGTFALLLILASKLWTEVLWYQQVGYVQVLFTEWGTRVVLFLFGAGIVGAAVFSSIVVAYRKRPIYPPTTPQQIALDTYREQIEPLRRLVTVAVPAGIGVLAGIAASNQWMTVQLFLNRQPFGHTDPQFGMDIGFYIFTLPMLRMIVSFLLMTVVLAIFAAVGTHYLYGGLTPGPPKVQMTKSARVHLAVLGAITMVIVAMNLGLDIYSLLTKTGDRFEGAAFVDIHAVLPSRMILAGVALVVAVLFVVAAVIDRWRLPTVGIALMAVSALIIGWAYPALIQRFQVTPNAQELEAEFIQRNIDATKIAFGLQDVEVHAYNAITDTSPGQLRTDAETTASIRLLDPAIVSPTFRQLQQNKQYYDFADVLSVDRYLIDGQLRDTVIAVRELNLAGLGADQRSWVNDHTVFTHGFGVVAAFGNENNLDGRPTFYQGGIPSIGELGEFEPRIYFGQMSPSYSIVGAPEGTAPWELDYPDDAAGGQVNTTYTGDGGPAIGGLLNRLLFAIKFADEEILFSERVTPESQILFDRDPRTRVEKVAPYLTLDGRVYPAVVDGSVVWIVDAYTTSDQYPYSAIRDLQVVTADSLSTTATAIADAEYQNVNYMRNSVKAVVDAYDGSVTLYAWDPEDPILQAWQSVFPNTIRPLEEISGELMSHLRYPEDLFKVQRQLLSQYHVQDAREFYSGQDFWANSPDPTRTGLQPPYYLTLQMPEQERPTFSLMSTFIPGGNTDRNVLTGFLAVNAEPGNTPGEIDSDYGQLRLLELARSATVPGPGQVQNNFNADPTVSTQLNLLRQGGSDVINGNLLTLPVGGGLLYVQPVYVQSAAGTQYPLLQKVLVAFGDKIGFADTLGEALDQVFGGDSGAETHDEGAQLEPSAEDPTTDEPTATLDAQARLTAALEQARIAMIEADAALQAGDFAAYGAAQDKLRAALTDALAADAELNPTAPPQAPGDVPGDGEETEGTADDTEP